MTKTSAKIVGIYLFKLVGTTVFLWWALSQIPDKSLLLQNFQTALQSPFFIVVGLSLSCSAIFAGALRWHILLQAQGIDVSYWYVVRLTLYGSLFNLVSVGTAAGDAAKILCLIRHRPDRKVPIALSVMVDHLIGFIATGIIFLAFAWGFQTVENAKDISGRGVFFTATLFQAGGILFVALNFWLCSPRMMRFCQRKFPKFAAQKWVQSTIRSIDVFRSRWKHSLCALAASIVLSLSFFLTFYAALRSLGQDTSAAEVLSVMPIVDAVSSLPISISGLGVRERTFDFLLNQLTGTPTGMAVAASLIGFVFHSFWGLVGGIAFITEPTRKKTPLLNNDED